MVLDALLIYYCGKNGTKKKKILKVLDTIKFNEDTNEFICKSSSIEGKTYTVMYSTKSQEWFCDCPAILYKPYKTYESPEEKYRKKQSNYCVHILASRIYKTLKVNDMTVL